MTLASPEISRRQDRMALALFLGPVIALSLVFDIPMAQSGTIGIWNGWAVLLRMWAPGAAAVVTSLVVYRSLRPLGLLGNRRLAFWAALCLLLPILYTLIIYPALRGLGLISATMMSVTLSMAVLSYYGSVKSAFGEELGWRGFAAPIFSRVFGFKLGQFLMGVIWFVYHMPALLFTDYGASAHPVFGNIMFFITMIALSYFLGWARQQSDSVWPSTLFRASHNLIFLHLFQPITLNTDWAGYLIGEQGLPIAIVQSILGAVAIALF